MTWCVKCAEDTVSVVAVDGLAVCGRCKTPYTQAAAPEGTEAPSSEAARQAGQLTTKDLVPRLIAWTSGLGLLLALVVGAFAWSLTTLEKLDSMIDGGNGQIDSVEVGACWDFANALRPLPSTDPENRAIFDAITQVRAKAANRGDKHTAIDDLVDRLTEQQSRVFVESFSSYPVNVEQAREVAKGLGLPEVGAERDFRVAWIVEHGRMKHYSALRGTLPRTHRSGGFEVGQLETERSSLDRFGSLTETEIARILAIDKRLPQLAFLERGSLLDPFARSFARSLQSGDGYVLAWAVLLALALLLLLGPLAAWVCLLRRWKPKSRGAAAARAASWGIVAIGWPMLGPTLSAFNGDFDRPSPADKLLDAAALGPGISALLVFLSFGLAYAICRPHSQAPVPAVHDAAR